MNSFFVDAVGNGIVQQLKLNIAAGECLVSVDPFVDPFVDLFRVVK